MGGMSSAGEGEEELSDSMECMDLASGESREISRALARWTSRVVCLCLVPVSSRTRPSNPV
eukprot:2524103-Alexandrium_andersonii.AAC.1